MLEHAGTVPIRKRFKIKIAENSETFLNILEKLSLEITKVGAFPSKQNNTVFLKTFWTYQGRSKVQKRVFSRRRYNIDFAIFSCEKKESNF